MPLGTVCKWDAYTKGVQYAVYPAQSSSDCANLCLRTASCTGLQVGHDESFCALWFDGACDNATTARALFHAQTEAEALVWGVVYARREFPPPMPPYPPQPPSPPPSPLACEASCGSGNGLQCRALLSLECTEAERMMRAINCTDCHGCCNNSPKPPPRAPPPSMPSPPQFPIHGCPWQNASSEEHDVLVCFDGTRCNWLIEGFSCCTCHGGRAICPLETPNMCAGTLCAHGLDHCCDTHCPTGGWLGEGERACPAVAIEVPPKLCTIPPPLPPAPPPSPPLPPAPPLLETWQDDFEILHPPGTSCYLSPYYESGTDYLLYTEGQHSPTECANRCLRDGRCTGFRMPNDESYCVVWYRWACSNASSVGRFQSRISQIGKQYATVWVRKGRLPIGLETAGLLLLLPAMGCLLLLVCAWCYHRRRWRRKIIEHYGVQLHDRTSMVRSHDKQGEAFYEPLVEALRQALEAHAAFHELVERHISGCV